MGTKSNPSYFDCYSDALPDEPMFVLLARDPFAPELVEDWAARRRRDVAAGHRPKEDLPMVAEAIACAAEMRVWRLVNDGKWRK